MAKKTAMVQPPPAKTERKPTLEEVLKLAGNTRAYTDAHLWCWFLGCSLRR